MRLTIILLLLTFTGLPFLEKAEACYQGFFLVQLKALTIAGTVSRHNKPLDGAVVRLHKFLGAYSIEIGHADPHVLSEAVAAKDGSFKFGEVPNGKYVLFVAGASMDVELSKPKSGENDIVAIENFADSCVSATVISADGRRLTNRSVPTIFGMGSFNKE